MSPTPTMGQIWADNDPRCQGRRFVIQRLDGDYAYVDDGRQRTRIRIDRLKKSGSRGYHFTGEWN